MVAVEIDEKHRLGARRTSWERFDPAQVELVQLEWTESVDQAARVIRQSKHDGSFVVAGLLAFLIADDREARLVGVGILDIGKEDAQPVTNRGLPAGNCGGAWLPLGKFCRGGGAGHLVQRSVRNVLAEPKPALRKGLRLAINAANHLLIAIGEQVMVDRQPDLGTNLQLRQAHEHVEGVGDPAIRRIL